MYRCSIISSVILATAIFLVAPALAQTAAPVQAGGFINIGQIFNASIAPYVDAIVQAFIAALVGWVVLKIKQKTGIDIDAGHRDAVTRALQNQANALLARGAAKMSGVKIQVDNLALANAATSLLNAVPDAAKHFGLTPQWAVDKILATLPQTDAGARMVADAQAINTATAVAAPDLVK